MTDHIACITDNPFVKAMTDISPSGIFAIDKEGYYTYSNRAFQQMTGLEASDINGTKWEYLIAPYQRKRVVAGVLVSIVHGETYTTDTQLINNADQTIDVAIRVAPVKEGELVTGCVGTIDRHMPNEMEYEAFKARNNTLQSLIENTSAAVFSFDKDLNYTAFNNTHRQTIKKSRGADIKIGDNYLELTTANTGIDREKTLELFKRVMEGEHVECIEAFGEPGMHRAWYSIICSPIRNERGAIEGISVFCQDISDRIRLQEEADKRTNLMQAMVDNTSAVLYSLDGNGRCTAFNRAAKDALKKARGADLKIGDNYPEIAGINSPKDKDTILHFLKHAMSGGRDKFIQELGDEEKYRAYYSVTTNPIEDAGGNITGIVVCSHDVTEHVRLQKENDEQMRLINRLLEHMPIAIYKIGPDDLISLSAGSGLKSVGLKDNEAVGMNIHVAVPHLVDNIHRGMAGEISDFVIYNTARNVYFHHFIFPDDDVKGGVIGFSIDITKNKLAENEILQNQLKIERQAAGLQELNDFKDRIFSIISHDLRSPINNLMAMASLFEEGLLTTGEIKQVAHDIRRDSEQVQNILDNLLKWSLLQADTSKAYTDIAAMPFLSGHLNMYKFLASKKQLHTQVVCDDNIMLYADENQLSLVIRNLIDNAVKFTPVGGEVIIGVNKVADKQRVYVSNSGPGIDEQTILRILSSRYMNSTRGTDNEKGTGLGLQLCKEFINSMGSTLQIESKEGNLTSFYFDMPA